MRPQRLALVALGLALGLASGSGCATRVHTDHDASADFARLQSFAWLDPPLRETPREEGAPPVDPFTTNSLLDKRVREAVERELVARGYRRAGEGESPDFQLRYEVVSRQVLRDSPTYVGGGYGYPGYGYRYGGGVVYPGTRSYEEGTIILDVIDPGSESLAWRGWAASRTREGHIDARHVAETVAAIVAEFPPGTRSEDD